MQSDLSASSFLACTYKRTVRYGPRSFAVAGPSMERAIPAPLCNDELSAMSFRRQLKTELYIRAYCSH